MNGEVKIFSSTTFSIKAVLLNSLATQSWKMDQRVCFNTFLAIRCTPTIVRRLGQFGFWIIAPRISMQAGNQY